MDAEWRARLLRCWDGEWARRPTAAQLRDEIDGVDTQRDASTSEDDDKFDDDS